MEKKSRLRRLTDKVYGGLPMTWPALLLFALAAAVVTAVFLIVPVFKNTSFERMGVTFEAWIFFAVIIMANCKKPLESALKTFVFFLVSQPLIYLFQVPFSAMGWGLFGYYKTWFIWTLLTFPMAYIGWYITKKNWLSLLILAPVLLYLSAEAFGGLRFTAAHFPRQLFMAFFCMGQVLLYLFAFTGNLWQRMAGLLLPLAAALLILLARPQLELNSTMFLPDDPVLSESAVVTVEDESLAEISVVSTGEDSMIRVHSGKYGTTGFAIRDGEIEYRYTLTIYQDEGGHNQIRIDPAD